MPVVGRFVVLRMGLKAVSYSQNGVWGVLSVEEQAQKGVGKWRISSLNG